jgi:formylglycine-generating enzyme required for sulfatase activity
MEAIPEGWGNKPVTCVSQEDARADASCGRKTPGAQLEWHAAQGTDGRAYPWGNTWNADAVSLADKGRTMPGPDAVDAHPLGASPFGVMDLVGNVWQWTEESGTGAAGGFERAATALGTHRETRKLAVAVSCWWKAAQVSVRSDQEWRSQYFHLAIRRGRKIAKVAMARRLAVHLHRMSRQGWNYGQLNRQLERVRFEKRAQRGPGVYLRDFLSAT